MTVFAMFKVYICMSVEFHSYGFFACQLNLLIATKVGEEGLDIQTCCLVIRFDLPETVASFIQSRGRARMLQSEYAFLVDRCFSIYFYLITDFVANVIIFYSYFSNLE